MNDVIFSCAGVGFCLVISAFFSGSETALGSLGRVRLQRRIDEGGPDAAPLRLWAEKPQEILTTILIYNNAANITASALATEIAHTLLDPVSDQPLVSPVPVAIGVMTLLLLTFGEIIPKTFAQTHAERLALPAMRVIAPARRVVLPIVKIFVALARKIGARTEQSEPSVQPEDIAYMVNLGGREGALTVDQTRMLQSVFDIDARTASDAMLPLDAVVMVPIDTPLQDLLEVLVRAGHSRIPVYDGERTNVVGVCYAKDVLRFIAESEARSLDLRSICRPARAVDGGQMLNVLLKQMQDWRVHLAMVRQGDEIVGIITLEDIVERLIGEVFDEHDRVASMSQSTEMVRTIVRMNTASPLPVRDSRRALSRST